MNGGITLRALINKKVIFYLIFKFFITAVVYYRYNYEEEGRSFGYSVIKEVFYIKDLCFDSKNNNTYYA
jgi:hypothetical protein